MVTLSFPFLGGGCRAMIMSSPFSGGGRPALIVSFPFLGGGHRTMIPCKSKCHLDDDEMTTMKQRGQNNGDKTTATKRRQQNSRRQHILSAHASPQRAGTSPPTHIMTRAFQEQREEGGAAVLFLGQVYKTHPLRNDVRRLRSTPETHSSNILNSYVQI
jgi:hypothetical protein